MRRLDAVEIAREGLRWRLEAGAPAEKSMAYDRIYWSLRARPESELLDVVGELARRAGVSSAALSDQLFMDWDEVAAFAKHPLVRVGAHSHTHRRLAQWPLAEARKEMAGSKAALGGACRDAPSNCSPILSATPPAPVRASSNSRTKPASIVRLRPVRGCCSPRMRST